MGCHLGPLGTGRPPMATFHSSIFIVVLVVVILVARSQARLLGKNCTNVAQCGDKLICNGTCLYCESSSQCDAQGKLKICKSKHCAHKGLVPISFWDPVVLIILFITGVVVAGAGVGGGGIFVPVLILAGGFLTKEAVPLSNTLICGASLANYIQLARLRHPHAARPLIYYDLALLVLPLIISGTIIGVLLYSMSPTWAILAILVVVLLTSASLTLRKGIRTYKQEATEEKLPYAVELQEPAAAGAADASAPKKTPPTVVAQSSFYYVGQTEVGKHSERIAEATSPKLVTRSSFVNFGRTDIKLDNIIEAEKHTPWVRVVILFAVVAAVSVFSILRGKNSGKSVVGVVACGGAWWALTWVPFVLLIATSGGVVFYLIDAERVRQDLGYHHIKGDISWTPKHTFIIAAVAIASGIVSSLVGIGGGMLLGPVMLELGILPDVTAATSSFMILFTSSAAVAQYASLGALAYDYAGIFFVSGFIASFLGQYGLSKLVKRFKKKSYIIFLILGIIVGSCVMLTAVGIMNITKSIKYHTGLTFKKVCAPSD